MSKRPKFNIHVNRELTDERGRPRKFYNEYEYNKAMEKAGVEHYQPGPKRIENKPYERSEWAREMHKDIIDRKGRAPGGRFIEELSKRGYNRDSFERAQRIANGGRP